MKLALIILNIIAAILVFPAMGLVHIVYVANAASMYTELDRAQVIDRVQLEKEYPKEFKHDRNLIAERYVGPCNIERMLGYPCVFGFIANAILIGCFMKGKGEQKQPAQITGTVVPQSGRWRSAEAIKTWKSIWLVLIVTLAGVGIAMLLIDTMPPLSMTDLSMQMCKRRVLHYAQEHGKLPSSLSETKPIAGYHSSIRDGWGVVLDYSFDTNGVVILRSLGKDRAVGGTGDDVDMIGIFPSKKTDGSWSDEFVEWAQEPFDAVRGKKLNQTSDGIRPPADGSPKPSS